MLNQPKHNTLTPADIAQYDLWLERAWTIMAGTSNGDWSKQRDDWREAATAWRDEILPLLSFRNAERAKQPHVATTAPTSEPYDPYDDEDLSPPPPEPPAEPPATAPIVIRATTSSGQKLGSILALSRAVEHLASALNRTHTSVRLDNVSANGCQVGIHIQGGDVDYATEEDY